ncbi:MAG: hypothetical protein U1C74_10895 [Phenylobacterium sp.]|nr:hypothetical protein [Phenylobacterium sp.]
MRAAIAGSIALALSASAQAQPDPIGAILGVSAPPLPPQAVPPQPTPPSYPVQPVFLHETDKATGGPPTVEEAAYDSRLRSSAAAIRNFQGPMEGAWALSGGGRDLFLLQLVDRDGWIDGAWRDPQRPGAPEASGLIADVPRGGEMTLRFADGVVAVLRPAGDHWTGRLTEAGRSQAVTLTRRPR